MPLLSDLIALAQQLAADERVSLDTLRRRDREAGQRLDEEGARGSDADRLLAWLDEVEPARRRNARWADRLAAGAGMLLAGLGLLTGWGAATAVFWYDADHPIPINVVWVLAIFVALNGLTLLLFLIAALPGRLTARVPGLSGLQDAASAVSPGRIIALLAGRLPQDRREQLELVLGSGHAHSRVYGPVHRWTLLTLSQIFALCFNLAALAAALWLIVFRDLAFGWSTTLELGAADFHALTQWVALPWGWAWADALPPLKLVQRTRFVVAEGLSERFIDSKPWWPFVVAAMLCYGVLPRLVTLFISRHRRHAAITRALTQTPGARRALERMQAHVVETRAPDPEVLDDPAAAPPGAATSVAVSAPHAGPLTVINWAQVPLDAHGFQSVGVSNAARTLHAGGNRSLDDDTRTLRDAAEARDAVVVIVKAWEPPLLEVLDFLRELRAALGEGIPIDILPLTQDEPGQEAAVWARKVRSLGDPWAQVVEAKPLQREPNP